MANLTPHPVDDFGDLKERVENYLASSSRGADIRELVEKLRGVGDVAIFGGMLRDFARGGEQVFNSDIDLVIDAEPEQLGAFFSDFHVHRNRFGGYRLNGRTTQFDVWALQSTWAIRERYVQASQLNDLIQTTFFNWDAIVYIIESQEIVACSNYIENIHKRTVDINLSDNPNVLGAIARTLRILVDWQGELAPALTDFLAKSLDDHCPAEIEKAQARTIGRVSIKGHKINALKDQLRRRDTARSSFKFDLFEPL